MIDYKKRLENALNKIGWKVKHIGGEHYAIVNHKGEYTGWELYDNIVDNRNNDTRANAYFNLRYSKIELVDNNYITVGNKHLFTDYDCVSVGNKHSFILFMNHDK